MSEVLELSSFELLIPPSLPFFHLLTCKLIAFAFDSFTACFGKWKSS
jgi:hypothetical protein